MPQDFKAQLIESLREARKFIAKADNDFTACSWSEQEEAFQTIDSLILRIEADPTEAVDDFEDFFATLGPVQEVALSSGWETQFLSLAERADEALAAYEATHETV